MNINIDNLRTFAAGEGRVELDSQTIIQLCDQIQKLQQEALALRKERGLTQSQIEQLAAGWDNCRYDIPGGYLDIGADIRESATSMLATIQADSNYLGRMYISCDKDLRIKAMSWEYDDGRVPTSVMEDIAAGYKVWCIDRYRNDPRLECNEVFKPWQWKTKPSQEFRPASEEN